MRSHYATLPLPPKTPQIQEEPTSSLSSSDKSLISVSYGLRENPKKSLRLVDQKGSMQKRVSGEEEALLTDLEMEEDVALCLVMLSRDVKWRRSSDHEMKMKVYECERCEKVFKSSQGLGSHRASHFKKIKKLSNGVCENGVNHECPFCGKVFKSVQALGGHKRSHFLASKFNLNVSDDEFQDAIIDLNLPAAMEDEEDDEVIRG
ncbi:hypothetical protein DH2020_005290 [Rehmannia glutinosa]|uniref:C2H2-type domain-containing protein n=1 Tax=Rehmannia glutinosa TaxID=99300 RepID=A0ABR0XFN6_REHGL